MASIRQVRAARQNVKKAQTAAKRERTIAHLPERTRRDLQAEARKGARRGGQPGHPLEDRNRERLYEIAKEHDIRGRSKMGKSDLIDAIRSPHGWSLTSTRKRGTAKASSLGRGS